MTFPTFAALGGADNTSQTDHIVSLPRTAVAGELIILFCVSTTTSHLASTGYSELSSSLDGNGAHMTVVLTKTSAGGETSATISTGGNSRAAWVAIIVNGQHATTAPEIATWVTSTGSTAPNPGSLNPTGWGTEDTLWIAIESDGNSTAPSGYPASYTNGTSGQSSSAVNAGAAFRQLNAASEDPGAFTITSAGWAASVIAVRPTSILPITAIGAIASAEAFGTVQINQGISTVGAITSAEAFGTALVQYRLPITAIGAIPSQEAFGLTSLARLAPTAPRLRVFIDFGNDGVFGDEDEVTSDLHNASAVEWNRGRSADFGSDATGAATFTLNNVGASLNEPGPYSPEIRADLLIGRAVLIRSEFLAVERGHFYGFIQRITPNAAEFTVTITCYDPLRRYEETDVVVAANPFVSRTCRDLRIAVLEDLERGDLNLLQNPSFETNVTGWTLAGGTTLTRITNDGASGSCSAETGKTTTGGNITGIAATNLLTSATAHGLFVSESVRFTTITGGTGLSTGVTYFVIASGLTATTFKLSATQGGGEIDFTTDVTAGTITPQTMTVSQTISLVPAVFAGQVYRFTLSLRAPSGSGSAVVGLGEDLGVAISVTRGITLTAAWQRVSVTYTAPTTRSANSPSMLRVFVQTFDTIRIDALACTRGQGQYPYADSGTGRWANFCFAGSFDAGDLSGWGDAWTNAIGNPSFEVNTSGWSVAGDAFCGAATSITRDTGTSKEGAACGAILPGIAGRGAFYAITGTFVAGVTYVVTLYSFGLAPDAITAQIGSNGTPGDQASQARAGTAGWVSHAFEWTPAANRTDVHLAIYSNGTNTIRVDQITVRESETGATAIVGPSTAPAGGGHRTSAQGVTTATPRYGYQSQRVTTTAQAGSGRIYDFIHSGAVFRAGQAYSMTVSVRPSSDMPYRIGLSSANTDGTTDDANTTGTALANVWTDVTLTWTPAADHSSLDPRVTLLYIVQTDTTARTLDIDGVRVIPGSTIDAAELPQWDLATEPDPYLTSAAVSGSALAALGQLNRLSLSRHYIRPLAVSPFYQYVVASRAELPSKVAAEVFINDFAGFEASDVDRDSIVNIVQIVYTGGREYYSDAESVGSYGPQPGTTITATGFLFDRTVPDQLGPFLLARYRAPRARPLLRRTARSFAEYQSQIDRELDDLIDVTLDRLGILGRPFLIVRLGQRVQLGGQQWTTTWALEEQADYTDLIAYLAALGVTVTGFEFSSAFSSAFHVS